MKKTTYRVKLMKAAPHHIDGAVPQPAATLVETFAVMATSRDDAKREARLFLSKQGLAGKIRSIGHTTQDNVLIAYLAHDAKK